MQRLWLVIGAVSGFLAVAAGAFGAHALAGLEERYLNVFKLAAQYQMYHALALVLLGVLPASRRTTAAGVGFLGGTAVFCGSLYLLALTKAGGWGAITPIGGVLFLIGWSALAWAALRRPAA